MHIHNGLKPWPKEHIGSIGKAFKARYTSLLHHTNILAVQTDAKKYTYCIEAGIDALFIEVLNAIRQVHAISRVLDSLYQITARVPEVASRLDHTLRRKRLLQKAHPS